MITRVLTMGIILVGCGVEPSTERLSATLNKAGNDIAAEGVRFNETVNAGIVKAISDTNEESIRVKDNSAKEGGLFNERMKENGRKINQDFVDEKAKATDRLVGSKDKQLEEIEQHNEDQDSRLDVLEAANRTVNAMIDALEYDIGSLIRQDNVFNTEISELETELFDALAELESTVEDNMDTVMSKIRKLRRKIRRVARNDDYCSVNVYTETRYCHSHWPFGYHCHKTTYTDLACPNGTYTIDENNFID